MFIFLGCSVQPPTTPKSEAPSRQETSPKETSYTQNLQTGQNQEAVKRSQILQLSNLFTTSFQISNASLKGKMVKSLTFAASSQADWVEISLCQKTASGNDCHTEKSLTPRWHVPLKPNDTAMLARVRACAESYRTTSLSSSCGEWSDWREFTQPRNSNTNILLQEQRLERVKKQFEILTEQKMKILKQFEEDAIKCVKSMQDAERMAAKREMVSSLLVIGETIAVQALTNGLFLSQPLKTQEAQTQEAQTQEAQTQEAQTQEAQTQVPQIPENDKMFSQMPTDIVSRNAEDSQKKLAKFSEYNDAVQNIAKSVGFFEEALPMNAVNTLGLAVFDLFTASKQIPSACSADERASLAIKAIDLQIASLSQELDLLHEAEADIKKKLQELYKVK